ncbi:MAG: hypothetical protein E7608_03695 [Ruminococcaceae bacterium]|nr:hypothetical protein [Oscillospiraceae bacterium]MBO5007091.1 hypothetical protein [Clostridia bacterium]
MKAQAIVYTSNTGFTKEYARILAEKTTLPLYNLESALKSLPYGSEVIYLGWLRASFVNGYVKAAKKFRINAVCGVCMGECGSQLDSVRKNNKIPDGIKVFTLQGGFDMKKLRGMNKFMMKIMVKHLTKDIMAKETRTEEDEKLLLMMSKGASFVSEKNLEPVIEFAKNS